MHTSFGPGENDGRFVFPGRFRWGKHASVGFVIEFLSFVEFDLCILGDVFFCLVIANISDSDVFFQFVFLKIHVDLLKS